VFPSTATIVQAFADIGPIQSVNVRVKDVAKDSKGKVTEEENDKSWALVSFRNNADAYQASKMGWNKGEDRSRRRARRASVVGGLQL
jgi:hypothetical protein